MVHLEESESHFECSTSLGFKSEGSLFRGRGNRQKSMPKLAAPLSMFIGDARNSPVASSSSAEGSGSLQKLAPKRQVSPLLGERNSGSAG